MPTDCCRTCSFCCRNQRRPTCAASRPAPFSATGGVCFSMRGSTSPCGSAFASATSMKRSCVRREQIGATEFTEFEAVLRQENFLLPPGDQQTLYEELASVYLELRFFAPHLLPHYFPAVGSLENVDRVLAQDVAAAEVFEGTRLRGADNPPPPEDVQDEQRRWFRMLLGQAERAGNHGNTVRSAILRAAGRPVRVVGTANAHAPRRPRRNRGPGPPSASCPSPERRRRPAVAAIAALLARTRRQRHVARRGTAALRPAKNLHQSGARRLRG